MKSQSIHKHLFAITLALAGMTSSLTLLGLPWKASGKAVVQSACFPPPSGMVSWWPGDNSAIDIQGSNNGVLQNGVTFATGKVEQAFSFDGVNDYVRVPHNANLDPGTGSFTLDAWVKTTSTSNQTLVSKYECGGSCPAGASSLYFLSMSAGKVVAEIRDSDGSSPGELLLTGTSNIADGNFHHVAILRDIATSQSRIYIDGALDASAALNPGSDGAIQDNDGEPDPLLIGGFFVGGTSTLHNPFIGLIDDLEYFNRALTQTEIQAIFNAGSAGKCKPSCVAPPAGMVSWWPGDGSANDIQDGNQGTLMNGTTFTTGKVGQGFSFDGVDDVIAVPASTNLGMTSAYTFDAWVNSIGSSNLDRLIAARGDATANDIEIKINSPLVGSTLQILHNRTNGGTTQAVAFAAPPLNQLFHLAVTFDGTTVRAYYNGAETALVSASNTITAPLYTNRGWLFGRTVHPAYAGLGRFVGILDEIEIFNRPLAASEIQAIVNAGSAGKCRTCTPPPPGMVNWWPGDGNANDIQGTNPGILQNGATFAPGKVAQAFSFDGVNDFVLVPDNSNLYPGTGSFTLDAWVKTTSTANQRLVSKYECGGNCPVAAKSFYFLSMSTGKVVAEIRDSDGSSPGELLLTGTSNIADGHFHHVAMLRDIATSQLRIYVDGGLDASAALNPGSDGAIQDNDGEADPLLIGGFFNGGTTTLIEPFIGLIDELEYFNRALTQTEIQAIANAGGAGKCKNRPPVAVCQSVTVSANSSCTASAWIDDGSSDPDGDTITLTQSPAGPYPLGNTTVSLTVTDSKGASSQCTATVTVVDTTAPQIVTLPGDASYQCAGEVPPGSPPQATASDNCGAPTITVSDASNGGAGSPGSPLIITRTFTAIDTAGNTGSSSQTITVIDNTPPAITGPQAVNISTGAGATACGIVVSDAVLGAATASDNCGGVTITRTGVPAGNFFPIGQTVVTYTATDARGNTATAMQTITVTDGTPPAPNLATLPDVTGQCSATISAAPTATDNCRGSVTGTTTNPVTYSTQGSFTVTWTFDDGNGNPSTQTQRVIVRDTTAPAIATADKIVNTDLSLCSALVAHGTTASDNCALVSLVGIRSDGLALTNPYPKGTTTIGWTGTDQAGNTSTATQTITVLDNQNPVLACPGNISAAGNIPGSCSANVSVVPPTATDNCGITSVVGVRSDGQPLSAPYTLGPTTIVWTATDTSGNQASCSSTVTVTNSTPVVTITGPPTGSVYAVNTPVNFSGSFIDNPGGTHVAIWSFDNVIQPGVINETTGAVAATHTFTTAGVYQVTLTVTDGCGGTGMADSLDGLTALVVIYDPDGGFVTGGGWITSPGGAYVPNPSLTGKANFGFVSKYEHGATVPTGQTEFQFKVANLNFHSTVYVWLVVAEARAQYKGTGTINGAGNYGFMLTAIDGQINGGGGMDKFRIKIWDKNNADAIVYDNQIGLDDDGNPTTTLGGGSIVIHK